MQIQTFAKKTENIAERPRLVILSSLGNVEHRFSEVEGGGDLNQNVGDHELKCSHPTHRKIIATPKVPQEHAWRQKYQ